MSTSTAVVIGVGAERGIGGAVCRRFAREGYHVLVAGRTHEKIARVAESIGAARHLVVLENGDLLVAIRGAQGGVRLLRDTTGDGRADVSRVFGPAGGTGPWPGTPSERRPA